MKIVVLIRETPDPNRTLRLTPRGKIDPETTRWIITEADIVALEAAVRLKEDLQAEVAALVLAVAADSVAIEALARGVDRVLIGRVAAEDLFDPVALKSFVVATFQSESASLLFMGDDALGPLIADALDLPLAACATEILVHAGSVRITRTVDEARLPPGTTAHDARPNPIREVLEVEPPAVVTVDRRLAAPSIVSLWDIVGARSKPVADAPKPTVKRRAPGLVLDRPHPREKRILATVDELAAVLRSEASKSVGAPKVDSIPLVPGRRTATLISSEAAVRRRPSLADASVVVAGGRSIGSAAAFDALIGRLADRLGAAPAASGGAVHSGFAPKEMLVGQTGATISPDVYIAAGISGADQHLGGLKHPRTTIAINSDPSAPIFRIADYCLVGDVHQVIPELLEKLG